MTTTMRALQDLSPGARVRVRDWRDGSLVDGTFIAFIARASMTIAPCRTVRAGQRFGCIGPKRPLLGSGLVIQRDFFCGDRTFAADAVVEVLDPGTPLERARRLAEMIDGWGRTCRGCQAFV